jgi:hypothetical protein
VPLTNRAVSNSRPRDKIPSSDHEALLCLVGPSGNTGGPESLRSCDWAKSQVINLLVVKLHFFLGNLYPKNMGGNVLKNVLEVLRKIPRNCTKNLQILSF